MPQQAFKVLILTAGYGEGHNQAAKNIQLALTKLGIASVIRDPCSEWAPRSDLLLRKLYRHIATFFPRLWGFFYYQSAKKSFHYDDLSWLQSLGKKVISIIHEVNPEVIISTYPIYPHFIDHAAQTKQLPSNHRASAIVITDSIEVHPIWSQVNADQWFVTDSWTQSVIAKTGAASKRIEVTGFAVNPCFEQLQYSLAWKAGTPFKILYFPKKSVGVMIHEAEAMLQSHPDVVLTIVLGRNTRFLLKAFRQLKKKYPYNIKGLGWCNYIPRVMAKHHLIVGKAGGATVHECLAARRPMLVNQFVPGQEEGNLKLLKHLGVGELSHSPDQLHMKIQALLANEGALWQQQTQHFDQNNYAQGSQRIADWVRHLFHSLS